MPCNQHTDPFCHACADPGPENPYWRDQAKAAQAEVAHWRRETEIRQTLLENERALCEIHARKRQAAEEEVQRLRALVSPQAYVMDLATRPDDES